MPTITEARKIAIACQGGGSHAAFTAGALKVLLPHVAPGSDEDERWALVGLSGTSGGALCALVAWYGLLTGGPDAAARLLDRLWTQNSAQLPGEAIHNFWSLRANDWPFWETQFNPYLPPLRLAELAATRLWPLAATGSPLSGWIRPDYFDLGALIDGQIGDEGFALIGDVGRFWSILRLADRWRVASLGRQLDPAGTEDPGELAALIGQRYRCLASLERAAARRPDGLLAAALKQAGRAPPAATGGEPHIDAIVKYVEAVTRGLPELLLGAADVGRGDFIAFSSTRAPEEFGISRAATLASAALPSLFQAVELPFSGSMDPENPRWRSDDRRQPASLFWDGLLSQNPPTRNFVSDLVDGARKPDEIIVVQINPEAFPHARQRLGPRISDRRNQLAGNLSLNQEMAFIDGINRRLIEREAGAASAVREGADADKPIQTLRLTLDLKPVEADLGRELDAVSKYDRDPALKDALIAHGREQAAAFLAVRAFFQHGWADGAAWAGQNLPSPLAAEMRDLSSTFEFKWPVAVDDMRFSRTARDGGLAWTVHAHWHAQALPKGHRDMSVRLRGAAELTVHRGRLAAGRLTDMRVTRVRRLEPARAAVPEMRKGA